MHESEDREARKHRLQTDMLYRIYCGTTATGTQFIVGHDGGDNAILLEFDTSGSLLRTAEDIFSKPLKSIEDRTLYFCGYFQNLQLRHPLSFELSTIELQEFHHQDFDIGIASRPDHFDFLEQQIADPDTPADERTRLEESIRQWEESRMFVFTWFNEYYVTERGLIVDS